MPFQMLRRRSVGEVGGEREMAPAHAGKQQSSIAFFGELEEAEQEQGLVRGGAPGASVP